MNIKKALKENHLVYCLYMKSVEKYNRFRYQRAVKKGKVFELFASQYKKFTGQELRNPPVNYTEKIQFAKMYESTEEKGRLSDKYAVREWVAEKIGAEHLIPLIGCYDKFDDVPWDSLPERFVIKTNHGSATNIVVFDKAKADKKQIKKKVEFWLSLDFAFSGKGFEMHYSYIKPKIIIEEFINDKNGELNDYRFLCFNGEPHYCWIDADRYNDHRRNVYDLDWQIQPWNAGKVYPNAEKAIEKPASYEEMIKLAKVLAEGFDHVRVDLYDVDGKIYFGEMTFTYGKGYNLIYPEKYNEMLGDLWKK